MGAAATLRVPGTIAARVLEACAERGVALPSVCADGLRDGAEGFSQDALSVEAVEMLAVWLNVHPAWLAFGLGGMVPCPKEVLVEAAGRRSTEAANVELVALHEGLRIRAPLRR